MSFKEAASAPNSLHTVGPVLPPSFFDITLSSASAGEAGGEAFPILPSLPPPALPKRPPSSLRSFSMTIIAPSRRSRFSVSESSSSWSSSSSIKFAPCRFTPHPPSKHISPARFSCMSPDAELPSGLVAVICICLSTSAHAVRGTHRVRNLAAAPAKIPGVIITATYACIIQHTMRHLRWLLSGTRAQRDHSRARGEKEERSESRTGRWRKGLQCKEKRTVVEGRVPVAAVGSRRWAGVARKQAPCWHKLVKTRAQTRTRVELITPRRTTPTPGLDVMRRYAPPTQRNTLALFPPLFASVLSPLSPSTATF